MSGRGCFGSLGIKREVKKSRVPLRRWKKCWLQLWGGLVDHADGMTAN